MEVIYGNKKNNQEVKLPLNIKNMENRWQMQSIYRRLRIYFYQWVEAG